MNTMLPTLLVMGVILSGSCGDEAPKLTFSLECEAQSCDSCNQDLQLLAQGGSVTVAVFNGDEMEPSIVQYQCLTWDEPLTLGQLPLPLNSDSLAFSFELNTQTSIFRMYVSSDRSGDCPPLPGSLVATGTSAALRVSEPDQKIRLAVSCP